MLQNTRHDWDDQRPDKNDTRADISQARADKAEARADCADIRADISEAKSVKNHADWNTFSDHVDLRAKVANARANRSETAATKLRTTIAIVIAIISIGCAGGIYFVNQSSADRASRNACAIKVFLTSASQARKAAGSSIDLRAAVSYDKLIHQLQPSIKTCKNILK